MRVFLLVELGLALNKLVLGVGSNLGDRHENIEIALKQLQEHSKTPLRISPCFETPALLPEKAPPEWDLPYLNLAVELHVSLSARDSLELVQKIERESGRRRKSHWEPRSLDLDILLFNNDTFDEPDLKIPHSQMLKRAFVLDPLKELRPAEFLNLARKHPEHSPLLMAIINLTPDSFSDGGQLQRLEDLSNYLDNVDKSVAILDIGAESTRPGATPLTWKEEWERLKEPLMYLNTRYKKKLLRPKISLDTRHPETAARALEFDVDIINDVSGASSDQLLDVVSSSRAEYILMHSLSVPADKSIVLSKETSILNYLRLWFSKKLDILSQKGINKDKIILDPGLGFGKSPSQSAEIIANIEVLNSLTCRVLVGHSRKSFLNSVTDKPFANRDSLSSALSVFLSDKGVDYLRVHNPLLHKEALASVQWIKSKVKDVEC